jgi:hypothetical protein
MVWLLLDAQYQSILSLQLFRFINLQMLIQLLDTIIDM